MPPSAEPCRVSRGRGSARPTRHHWPTMNRPADDLQQGQARPAVVAATPTSTPRGTQLLAMRSAPRLRCRTAHPVGTIRGSCGTPVAALERPTARPDQPAGRPLRLQLSPPRRSWLRDPAPLQNLVAARNTEPQVRGRFFKNRTTGGPRSEPDLSLRCGISPLRTADPREGTGSARFFEIVLSVHRAVKIYTHGTKRQKQETTLRTANPYEGS